ncbi:MAG: DnaD domain protein [Clostridiales Family XIII bacterium]|jgi:DnaD/phage-associated family protein|nr:DnaD domain protein [Clostridiales Family XIII bacterium]
MAYLIEPPINSNLEDTAIPNLFITDFMPDAPDGDFVKVYIYAYMCCRQGIALTHTELADRVGVAPEKVLAAWRYFASRRIVRLIPQKAGDEAHFDVEFADVKGMLYAKDKPRKRALGGPGGLADPALARLFQKIAAICGTPTIDGGDAQRISGWLEECGATAEIVEFAYLFCRDERGVTRAEYVEKAVKEWAGKGLKTVADVREYRARTDARSAAHKQLMEALGLRYSVITPAEEKKFNLWIDDYGYTPARLLELAEKTEGVGNKLKYLGGIIRKEREPVGKSPGKTAAHGGRGGNSMKDRNEHFRRIRQKNEDAAAARMDEAYAAAPGIKEADDEIALLNMALIKTLTSGMADKQSAVERQNKEIRATSEHRAELLTAAGFAADYTDVKYDCPRCKDTGVLENGASCDCYHI